MAIRKKITESYSCVNSFNFKYSDNEKKKNHNCPHINNKKKHGKVLYLECKQKKSTYHKNYDKKKEGMNWILRTYNKNAGTAYKCT